MIPIFDAARQGTKVRVIIWGSALVAAGSLYAAAGIYETYGINPGDGGVLKPLHERAAVAAFVAFLGLSFLIAMLVYGRCYVAAASLDEVAMELHLETFGLLGRRKQVLPVGDILERKEHAGRVPVFIERASGITVNAPWRSVRVAGRRLPLIVDAQGLTHDERLASILL